MKSGLRGRVLCLVLATLPVLSVFAQTPRPVYIDELPKVDPQTFSASTLPGIQSLYSPRSGLNKASLGTISSDIDVFMSALNWQSISIEKSIFFAGVDEWGLNIGYGAKFGSLYLGVSYGGGLIDELYRRLTNQNVDSIRKEDIISTMVGGGTTTDSQVIDALGNPLEGVNENTNTLQILLGAGFFGVRLGFAEALRSQELSGTSIFESSLKPILELGFNFRAGPVGIKFALRGAYDIHQNNSDITNKIDYLKLANPIEWYQNVPVHSTRRMDYTEPSAGITLGFDFGNGSTTVAEFDIVADGAIRFYKNNDKSGVTGTWSLDEDPANPGSPLAHSGITFGNVYTLTAENIFDLRISAAPAFLYRSDLSRQFTLGIKFSVEGGFDILGIDGQEITGSSGSTSQTTSDTTFSITPKLGAGAQFRLLPDRFAVQAGFGIELFSYISNKSDVDNGNETVTRRIMGLPNASFAAGFTLNFTAAAAMDLLAISKNLDIDETKLTLLFTIRK